MMHNRRLPILLAVFAASTFLRAEDPPPRSTLEQIVGQWTALRQQIAEEARNWREKEPAWRLELQLLKTEESALQKEIADAGDLETSIQKDRTDLLRRKEKMEAVLAEFAPVLNRAEAELRRWEKIIPPTLSAPLAKGFREIPATREDARNLSVSRRVQVAVALYTQIESLQQNVNVIKEVLPAEGNTRREMDVLYVGLAQAFAVSPDNQWAAIGTPGPDGWQWAARPSISGDVRKAIRVIRREEAMGIVKLPLQVSKQQEPSPPPARQHEPSQNP